MPARNGLGSSLSPTRCELNSDSSMTPSKRKSASSVSPVDHVECSKEPARLKEMMEEVADTAPVPNFGFRQTCLVRELHGRSVFGIAFNCINRNRPTDPLLFATCAGHYVTIYQCNPIRSGDEQAKNPTAPILLLQSFADPAGADEEFYCCAWSRDTGGNRASNWWFDCCEVGRPHEAAHSHLPAAATITHLPPHQQLVAVAGRRGVIRLLCPSLAGCPVSLVGHGSAVNELRFHPRHPALLFSFSKDYTVRLWNIATRVLICIFGGAEGHRAEVIHGDLSLTGDLLLTAGMDHNIKIWRLNTQQLAKAVIDSFNYRAKSNPNAFPLIVQNFPEFSSRDIHGNYVDCARWFGSLIISKSCENSVILWKPGTLDGPPSPSGSGPPDADHIEVEGVRLPKRLEPVGDQTSMFAMTGVPTEHRSSIIHQLKAPDCNLWYIRFDVDLANQVLALGTSSRPARIYLWDLKKSECALNLPAQTLHISTATAGHSAGGGATGGVSLLQSAIRQTRFSSNGKTLICVGDNGLIVRFDRD